MTWPGYPPPAEPPRRKRRRWLVGVVVGWIVVLALIGVWSVRHGPATVPEQRDIAQALPVLERATAAMLAAADGPGRAVRLGALRLDRGCRLTPVRSGVEAIRDVIVYVQADQARNALAAIAEGLPRGYRPNVSRSARTDREELHADAGSYVSIDADTLLDAQVLTVEAATGCRPDAKAGTADPRAGDPPAALDAVITALGRPAGDTGPVVQAVACADGGVAATYTVDGLPRTADVGRSLGAVTAGASVVRSDPRGWAYRAGDVSVVVIADPTATKVYATTPCG